MFPRGWSSTGQLSLGGFLEAGAVSVTGRLDVTSCQPGWEVSPKMPWQKAGSSFFQMTFRSPKWRSLSPWKGHLNPLQRSLGTTWFRNLYYVIYPDESEWCVYFLHIARCVFEGDLVEISSTNTLRFSRYPVIPPEVRFCWYVFGVQILSGGPACLGPLTFRYFLTTQLFLITMITLPKTNSSHLKMDDWKTILSSWEGLPSGKLT